MILLPQCATELMVALGSWIVGVDSCLDSWIAESGVDSTDIVAGHYN